MNVGIVAANVLPLGPLFSSRQRAAIRAEGRAKAGNQHKLRPATELGKYRSSSRASSRSHDNNSVLIIEGPRNGSSDSGRDGASSLRALVPHDNSDAKSVAESYMSVPEGAWPRGIIKTVEVEVTEEDIADVERGERGMMGGGGRVPENGRSASRLSVASAEDWAQVLRNGPTPPVRRRGRGGEG